MKGTLRLLLGIAVISCFVNTASAATRVVLCEEFYSEGWPDCPLSSGTLASLEIEYSGRIAYIENHINASYTYLYQAEAAQRASWYAVPYYGDMYYDGTYGDWPPSTWEAKIVNRMNKPSPITLTIWGTYNSVSNSGTVYAKFRNDSTATISGNVYFVITEDSIYYAAPNGDNWHNRVARDYVPNASGTAVTIAAGDSTTRTQAFTINSAWNENRCQIVTWIQNTSTKNVFQSGRKDIMTMVGTEELIPAGPDQPSFMLVSNPCTGTASFSLYSPVGTNYRVDIFDAAGRKVNTLSGIATGGQETITWNLSNHAGTRVTSGVYFYRFESARMLGSGKIVVK